jgi:hypothetical protein
MWFSWIIDVGGPGPDRGLGGKYLIVGPTTTGRCPRAATSSPMRRPTMSSTQCGPTWSNDPGARGRERQGEPEDLPLRAEGAWGTSIAEALEGAVRLAEEPTIPETTFVEASGMAINTIPPSDYGFFELINENVQAEPPTSYDVELSGQLAAIGIVHGKPFAPDERMKKILTDAAAVGQAAGGC